MKTTILLCEGPHDTAFLTRIMRTYGYNMYNESIKDYPEYLANFILKHVVAANVEELNIQEARNGKILPYNVLISQDSLLLMFSLGGDSREERRSLIANAFKEMFEDGKDGIMGKSIDGHELRIVFFFDADKSGIHKREEQMRKELSIVFETEEGLDKLANLQYIDKYNIQWGLYIFHDHQAQEGQVECGTLEDLVLPMMVEGNEDISDNIEAILSKRLSYNLFKGDKKSFKHDKAKIGMLGQLDKSGSANPAIIEQSRFITDEQILKNNLCKEIMAFLS